MGPPTSPVPCRALRQVDQACEADPAIIWEGIMRIAAIAIIALCMAAPAAAEEVLYCTDTDSNGFVSDKQGGKASRAGSNNEDDCVGFAAVHFL